MTGTQANSASERFVRDVVLTYEGDDCLRWPFHIGKDGYGRLRRSGKGWLASRYVCTLAHGPAPSPLHDAAHSCGHGDEACVTKRHLSWKTKKKNQSDRVAHGTALHKVTPRQLAYLRMFDGVMKQRTMASVFGISQALVWKLLRKGYVHG